MAKTGNDATAQITKTLETMDFDTVGGVRSFRSDHQAIGDSNLYHFSISDKDPRGWTVADFVAENNAAVAPPPTPGQALKE